jgi:hypothetical protein
MVDRTTVQVLAIKDPNPGNSVGDNRYEYGGTRAFLVAGDMAYPLQLEYEPKKDLRRYLRAEFAKLFFTLISRRFIVRFVGVAAIVTATGYLSDRLSLAGCERRTAIDVAKVELRGRPFHAGQYDEADTRAIFTEAGIASLPSLPLRRRDGLPNARISHARSVGPFIVDVEYGCGSGGPTGGHGGIRRYVCLFGITVQIADHWTWLS